MRKSTKLAILVAALVALCSFAALAADTWKQEGDQWFCLDKDGNPYYGAWKKSGSNYYYLDDATGAMVTNKLVESDGYKYWCGEDGARVMQKWVQVPNESNTDDGFEWMFFQALTGKAVVGDGSATFKSIKNSEGVTRKYLFNSDGYMLSGYLDASLNAADDVIGAVYYMGPKSEGWQRTEWQKFVDGELGGSYESDSVVYFYFKNSKKITYTDCKAGAENRQYKVSTGKYYTFNEDGALLTGYQFTATSEVATSAVYLGASDDGLLKKKVWVKTNAIEKTGDSEYWYYMGSDGHPVTGVVKKINGKFYLLTANGRMLTGLATLENADLLDPTAATAALATGYSTVAAFKADVVDPDANEAIYYFSSDADNDGSMKTGAQTVTIDGEEITVYLDKHGVAYEGIVSSKIYNNGILQTAGDQKYAIATVNNPADDEDDYYLVNAAGTVLNNTKVVDADGIWWVVTKDTNDIYKFADREYSATAASKWKSAGCPAVEGTTFKIGDTTYAMYVDETKAGDGYAYVTWEKVVD